MSVYQTLVDNLDTLCISTFGVAAVHYPQTTPGDNVLWGGIPITGIFEDPALAEDYIPGSLPPGVTVVRFFIRLADLTVQPKKGDLLVINAVQYSVFDLDIDVEGSATLKLRKN
jgi:hypothetical protein